jgi:hypothetical protein
MPPEGSTLDLFEQTDSAAAYEQAAARLSDALREEERARAATKEAGTSGAATQYLDARVELDEARKAAQVARGYAEE